MLQVFHMLNINIKFLIYSVYWLHHELKQYQDVQWEGESPPAMSFLFSMQCQGFFNTTMIYGPSFPLVHIRCNTSSNPLVHICCMPAGGISSLLPCSCPFWHQQHGHHDMINREHFTTDMGFPTLSHKSWGSSWSQARPSPSQLPGPGSWYLKAWAGISQAKDPAFRPSPSCNITKIYYYYYLHIPPQATHTPSIFKILHVDIMHMTPASNDCKYIVHGWDNLMFWPEARTHRNEKVQSIAHWLYKDILCHWEPCEPEGE